MISRWDNIIENIRSKYLPGIEYWDYNYQMWIQL